MLKIHNGEPEELLFDGRLKSVYLQFTLTHMLLLYSLLYSLLLNFAVAIHTSE